MSNLMFSLNASMPLFLLMVLGALFKRIGWMDDVFATRMNSFVFKVALPVMVYHDLATVDFFAAWNTKFVVYCFVVTALSILISVGISYLFKDRSIQGEFIQGSYRSSAALLGIAFIQNIYGTSGMGPLMIIGSVPLYNIVAVIVLSCFRPDNRGKIDRALVKKTCIGILKNPILIGIFIGFAWSLIGIPMPVILEKTTSKLAGVATPLGLMAMGASLDLSKITGKLKPALIATFLKLVGFCCLFLPLAAFLGFHNEEMIAILVMLGSCSTVSGYVMARNMGHEGVVASSCVMLTTLLCAFTLTFWLFLLRTLGLV